MKCYKCGESMMIADQMCCSSCDATFPPPVRLFVKHRRTLQTDAPGLLTCWFQQETSGSDVAEIELEVLAPKLGHLESNLKPIRVMPGKESPPVNVRFQTLGACDAEIEFFVTLNQRWVGRGTQRLHVAVLQGAANQPVINIHGGSVEGSGARLGDQFHVNFPSLSGGDATAEETFEIALHSITTPEAQTQFRSLHLTFSGGRSVTLVASENHRVTLGRNRLQDIVLRGGSEESSSRISRQHAVIEFGEHVVSWIEVPSEENKRRFGTELDGAKLDEDQPHAIADGKQYLVGQAVTIVPTRLVERVDPALQQSCEKHARRLGTSVASQKGRYTAVRLECQDDVGRRAEYLVMQRAIRIGSHSDCALQVSAPDVRLFHARIVHLAGRFWIEPCQQDCVVLVRGERVAFGHRVALQAEDEFVLGGSVFVVQLDATRR